MAYQLPQRPNFAWGAGATHGDTNSWTPDQWAQYYQQHPDDPYAAQFQQMNGPATATDTTMTPTPSGPPPPITTAQQVTSGTTPVGQTAPTGTPSSVASSFQQALVNRLNPQAVNASDPNIAPAIQANNVAQQRGLALQRNALAEDAARSGTDMSGGNSTALAGLIANSANQQGQFAGNLINQQSQLNQVNQGQAMGMAGGLLSGQQSLAQQSDLAQLQAAIQREALQQQGQLGQGQLNLGLLSALLANQQFGQSLGQQASEFGQGLDTQTILGMLSGL